MRHPERGDFALRRSRDEFPWFAPKVPWSRKMIPCSVI